MQVKTRGIVLNFIKYKESSIITKIYTEELGAISCIVNGVRSSKSKSSKIGLYQALTLLDLVVYHRHNQSLHRVSEAKIDFPYQSIPFEMGKTTIALFLTEMLGKVLKEEEKNEDLFDFMNSSFESFDEMKGNFANFHLQFLIQLTEYLGFGIFSLASFVEELSLHKPKEQSLTFLSRLLNANYHEYIPANGHIRHEVLTWLIRFYQLHFENFGQLKSLEVLREIQA